MNPRHSTKRKSVKKGRHSSSVSQCEMEGISKILEESMGHLSQTFDKDKVRRSYSMPTNSFGEIEFTGMNQSAKFIKLPYTTMGAEIQSVLQSKWELNPPTLVISIFGGDFEKKRKLKMIFKKGLWKAAESAGCWIVTEGFNLGIMKLAGEAVRDYTDAYGGNKMIAIGVGPWQNVSKNDVLENAINQGGTAPAVYQAEEETTATEDGSHKEVRNDNSLDPNHSHFFLFDTGLPNAGTSTTINTASNMAHTPTTPTDDKHLGLPAGGSPVQTPTSAMPSGSHDDETKRHSIAAVGETYFIKQNVQFRTRFEHAISSWKGNDKDTTEVRVPICGLVVGGDIYVLRQIVYSIIENKCPIVVCQGTSGAADIIALGLDTAQKMALEEAQMDEADIIPLEVRDEILETRLEQVIRECIHKINPEVDDLKNDALILKEVVTDLSYLISVFDMEEDWDLDGYIISSLLSSAGTDLAPNQLNLEQLEITLTLNRADIAKEKIFLENKKWKKGDLNDYMFNALMSDRHDFVKLFLEQGFSLEEFLTLFTLEKLYTDQLKEMNSRVAIFHQIWEHHKTHRMAQNVKLREVGKVVKVLVGDFYHPLYLSKEFQIMCLKTLQTNPPTRGPSKKKTDLPKLTTDEELQRHLTEVPFNEYKMYKIADGCYSNSLLHLLFIDHEIENAPSVGSKSKHQYDNKGMDSGPDSITKDPKSLMDTEQTKRSSNNTYDTLKMNHINSKTGKKLYDLKQMNGNNIHRRTSSLDMIEKLSQYNSSTYLVHSTDSNIYTKDGMYRRKSSIDMDVLNKYSESKSISSDSSKKSLIGFHKPEKTREGKDSKEFVIDDLDETKLKEVSLERPARELMIWSVLVGKLQMAELFWTMEKEPIAAALLASMILSSLASKSDDCSDTEEFKSYSKHFETQAEGVLNECYVEDVKRAQMLINKELQFYGRSSVILLAAEGLSIKFMAHPCCQDFLTNTWYGDLSSKNSGARTIGSCLLGMSLPFIIPNVIIYKSDENINQITQNKPIKDTVENDIEVGLELERSMAKSEIVHIRLFNSFMTYVTKIRSFYFAPIVRFFYNAVSYITFLLLFSTFILFKFKIEYTVEEIVIAFWVGTLLLEEIKQIFSATLSGISFSTYFSDGWNKLDTAAISTFVIGFILRSMTYLTTTPTEMKNINTQYHIILTDNRFIAAQIFMASSLFFFYVRIMYIFSFHIALGPKLIMITKMISNDLVPFMIILMVFTIGYGVTSTSIAFPLGLKFTDNMVENVSTIYDLRTEGETIMNLLSSSYFSMFGDFGLDSIKGETKVCDASEPKIVPTKISRTIVVLFLGIYVLLTNILLFNLLIAMFSRTYEEIEGSSVYYWNYQRYQMISEFVNRSPLVAPFIIFWHTYEFTFFLRDKFNNHYLDEKPRKKFTPFCIDLSEDSKKERELIKWEHMKAMDFLRNMNEPTQKTRQKGADGKSMIFRGMGGGGNAAQQALAPAGMGGDGKIDFSGLTEELNHQLDKRFKEVDTRMNKFTDLETSLGDLGGLVKELASSVASIQKFQNELATKVDNFPKCQCTEMVRLEHEKSEERSEKEKQEQVTKLELAVRSAMSSFKADLEPMFINLMSTRPEPAPPEEDPQLELAFSTTDDIGDINKDPLYAPDIEDINTGRIIERVINNHRVWRYLPFNFEQYPGMRMKVPNNIVSWQVPYSDYNAYDASEETLLYPSEHCHDTEDPTKYKDTYNTYDVNCKVKRQSMLGQYAIDPESGAPLNPTGRTGLKGKGLLPHWGPNHSVTVLITRWARNEEGGHIMRGTRKLLQYVGLERTKRFCIPWYLLDHTPTCDLNECAVKTTLAYMEQRLLAQFSDRKTEFIKKKIMDSNSSQTFKGFLDDHLNADNAWVETVVINFQESEKAPFTDDLLKIFQEDKSTESVKWLDLAHSVNLRTSHDIILKTFAQKMNAFF